MSVISSSIWNQDNIGEWKLYFNTNSDIPQSSINTEKEKSKKNNINISDKNISQGTLVMTPKGIGRLIKSIDNIAHIRFNQEIKEEQIPLNEISNVFNCYITFMRKSDVEIIRLKLPVEGTVQNIFEELSKLKKIKEIYNNYSLIYNKNKLKRDYTFDQIKLENNSKILLIEMNEVENKIMRFGIEQAGWYTYSRDAICFNPSENIKLLGVSVYCPYDNTNINGTLKIVEGQQYEGKLLAEENVEIPPTQNKSNIRKKIKLKKSIVCKKNVDYTIVLYMRNNGKTYFGSKGKNVVEGENGINFTFKQVIGNNGRTSVNLGNFPELFYYLD